MRTADDTVDGIDLATHLDPQPERVVQLRMRRQQHGDQLGDPTDDRLHVGRGERIGKDRFPDLGIAEEVAVHIDEDTDE